MLINYYLLKGFVLSTYPSCSSFAINNQTISGVLKC